MGKTLIIAADLQFCDARTMTPPTENEPNSEAAPVESAPKKTPPSDMRRKLNALMLLSLHDALMVPLVAHWINQPVGEVLRSYLGSCFLGVQLVAVVWLMLPQTNWRMRTVALSLAIGVFYMIVIGSPIAMVLRYMLYPPPLGPIMGTH